MYVDYFETSALVGVGRAGERVTLDHLHKAAWSVFTGTGKLEVPKGTQRPFVFSADPVPGRENVFLMVIRSAVEFPRATHKSLSLEEGDTWRFGLRFKGLAKRMVWNSAKEAYVGHRGIVAEEDIEEKILEPALSRHGFEMLKVSLMGPTFMKHKASGYQKTLPPLWYAEVEGVVSDPLLMANAMTAGITHGKAYGFGMLSVLKAPAHEKAA